MNWWKKLCSAFDTVAMPNRIPPAPPKPRPPIPPAPPRPKTQVPPKPMPPIPQVFYPGGTNPNTTFTTIVGDNMDNDETYPCWGIGVSTPDGADATHYISISLGDDRLTFDAEEAEHLLALLRTTIDFVNGRNLMRALKTEPEQKS